MRATVRRARPVVRSLHAARSTHDFPCFSRGPLPAEPFGMRCRFAVLTAALLACFTFPARAADESSTTTAPVVATPESKLGADRLTMSIGTPALGGLWIDGQDGHSFSGLSDRTPALAGDVEYGHVFTPWM